jgi:hypothetical protein
VVAELAAKAFDSNRQNVPWGKLEVILKLNFRQYGQDLIGHLNIFWENNAVEGTSSINGAEHLFARVQLIAELFDDFSHNSNHKRHDRITDLAQTRLAALRLELLEAGFDPRDPADLIQRFIGDPECMADYVPLLNEALWQFNALVFEIARHCPEGVEETENLSNRPELAWLNDMKRSLLAADLSNKTIGYAEFQSL